MSGDESSNEVKSLQEEKGPNFLDNALGGVRLAVIAHLIPTPSLALAQLLQEDRAEALKQIDQTWLNFKNYRLVCKQNAYEAELALREQFIATFGTHHINGLFISVSSEETNEVDFKNLYQTYRRLEVKILYPLLMLENIVFKYENLESKITEIIYSGNILIPEVELAFHALQKELEKQVGLLLEVRKNILKALCLDPAVELEKIAEQFIKHAFKGVPGSFFKKYFSSAVKNGNGKIAQLLMNAGVKAEYKDFVGFFLKAQGVDEYLLLFNSMVKLGVLTDAASYSALILQLEVKRKRFLKTWYFYGALLIHETIPKAIRSVYEPFAAHIFAITNQLISLQQLFAGLTEDEKQEYFARVDDDGHTAFFYACKYKKQEIIDFLLSNKPVIDNNENNPLIAITVENNNYDLTKRLLELGVDPNTPYRGQPPVFYYKESRFLDLLASYGVDINKAADRARELLYEQRGSRSAVLYQSSLFYSNTARYEGYKKDNSLSVSKA